MSSTSQEPLRVDVVLGTRPEAVKLLPVIRALRETGGFAVRVVATAQHREMLDQILAPFGVKPDLDLDVMQPGQTLNELVARVVPLLDQAFADGRPELVLVQGDTTSAFCAALVASQRGIRVGHVEAGLRSFDKHNPFPEESNRRMIGALADLHFAPTQTSADNLAHEGVAREAIVVCGNTAIDALLAVLALPGSGEPACALRAGAPLVLITLHRRENWLADPGQGRSPLQDALRGIARAARAHPEADFVYPVHRNPNVVRATEEVFRGLANVQLLAPLPHIPFVRLMERAHVIVTDSGGIQEEGPTLGVPVLVTRKTTERPEGLLAGTNTLVGTGELDLARALERALAAPPADKRGRPYASPFGDGRAALRIRETIEHAFGRDVRAQTHLPLHPRKVIL
jgi:UDP-N-acetylglucosamine 2-epimerase